MDVEFQEETAYAPVRTSQSTGGILNIPIRLGLVKNEQDSIKVWLGVIVICIGIIVWTLFSSQPNSAKDTLLKAQVQSQNQQSYHAAR